MSNHYITAADNLPEERRAETTLQVTDAQTKRIFEARVRIAREPDALTDPQPLTVVTGPHESVSEEWYVELIDEIDPSGVDEERLRRLADEQQTRSNVVNTRSEDLNVLLRYLVETGEYESTAGAIRTMAFEYMATEYPTLLERYDELRTEYEADPLRRARSEQS
ncbi:MAG: ubiD operon protein [Halorientalis sp.]